MNPAILISTFQRREWLAYLLAKRLLRECPGCEIYIGSDGVSSSRKFRVVNAQSTWYHVMSAALHEIENDGYDSVFLIMEDHYPNDRIDFKRVWEIAGLGFASGASQVVFPSYEYDKSWSTHFDDQFDDFSHRSSLMPSVYLIKELRVILEKMQEGGEYDPWSFETTLNSLHLVAHYGYPCSKDGLFNHGYIDLTNLRMAIKGANFNEALALMVHSVLRDFPRKALRKFTKKSTV